MELIKLVLCSFSLLVAPVLAANPCNYTIGAPVNTTSGMVQGHRALNATQVSAYLGIPFAQPPIGKLRFAPPVAYTSNKTINAAKFGHDCPAITQGAPSFLKPNVVNLLDQLGQKYDDPQEDCLYINVWTKPQVGAKTKPVLVWIYGGGFTIGGTNTTAYSGQFWADTEDVVFVNFNYRLSVFGFPGSPAATQNVALLDQRMALEWVRDNIAGFGGDPTRIVIFGQSAGGASVDYYNYAWYKDPIIAGSILQSGTANAFGNRFPEVQAKNWYNLTRTVGCGDNTTHSDNELLSCMRQPNITMQDLLKAESSGSGLQSILGNFGPTIDNKTVFNNYTDLAVKGKFAKVPMIVGNNDYEAGLFILVAAGGGASYPQTFWNQFDLHYFTCPAQTAAYLREIAGIPVWRYRYFGMFPNLELPTSIGRAWHGAELLPMFGSSEAVTLQDSTWQERSLGSYMRGAWAAFARCPKSGLIEYGWPKYNNKTDSLILLGQNNSTLPTFVDHDQYDTGCPLFYNGNLPG